jgi:hypothetical protein
VFVDWKQNKPQKPAKHPADDSTPSVSVDEEQEDMMVPGPDMFQGFSFVSSRAHTNDSSAGALPSSPSATATATTTSSATPASTFFYSSSKLASVYTRFTICIKQAAALPTTATGHKVWVTWKCGKKKESSGQTDRVVCVDREASWSDPTGKSSGFVFELELSLAFDEEAQEFSNKTLELTLHSETGKIGKFKGLSVCYGLMATTTWHTVRQTERQRERDRHRQYRLTRYIQSMFVAELAHYARPSKHLVAQTQVLSISENKSDSAAHATLVLLLQCEWLLYNEQELVPASALDAAAKEVSQPITLSGVQYYPKAMSRVLLAATDSSQQPIECITRTRVPDTILAALLFWCWCDIRTSRRNQSNALEPLLKHVCVALLSM